MSSRGGISQKIVDVTIIILVMVTFLSCGGSSSTTSAGGGATLATCAASSSDYYVVENAECVDAAGKISRINPDVPCKEELLTGLNCPVDFVRSTVDAGIGYLSSRTDGILQVNLTAKTTTSIVTTETLVSPAGLYLLESITDDERENVCGGNTLTDAILLIADEGTEEGGMIWRWCLITDDVDILSSGSNPSPVSEVGPAQLENPRGVVVASNRTTVYATGHNPDITDSSQSALLVSWELNESALIIPDQLTSAGDFSAGIKDLSINADGIVMIADAGQEAILQYDPATTELTARTGFSGGPRDILPFGDNSSGEAQYLVSEFDEGIVSLTTLLVGSDITSTTTDLTLSGPDGLTQ